MQVRVIPHLATNPRLGFDESGGWLVEIQGFGRNQLDRASGRHAGPGGIMLPQLIGRCLDDTDLTFRLGLVHVSEDYQSDCVGLNACRIIRSGDPTPFTQLRFGLNSRRQVRN